MCVCVCVCVPTTGITTTTTTSGKSCCESSACVQTVCADCGATYKLHCVDSLCTDVAFCVGPSKRIRFKPFPFPPSHRDLSHLPHSVRVDGGVWNDVFQQFDADVIAHALPQHFRRIAHDLVFFRRLQCSRNRLWKKKRKKNTRKTTKQHRQGE